ncbi:MAG: hypothetical protein KGO02_03895, partial [Alphaproteobacteria bacterium]|nr:hypothetical protein [Alphaproteobacteria bacterium]
MKSRPDRGFAALGDPDSGRRGMAVPAVVAGRLRRLDSDSSRVVAVVAGRASRNEPSHSDGR